MLRKLGQHINNINCQNKLDSLVANQDELLSEK